MSEDQNQSVKSTEKTTETTGSGWAGDKDPKYRDLPELGNFEKKQEQQREAEAKKQQ